MSILLLQMHIQNRPRISTGPVLNYLKLKPRRYSLASSFAGAEPLRAAPKMSPRDAPDSVDP